MMRIATADYSFPLLSWEKSLRLARDLGVDGIDISLFKDRSQLKPEHILAKPTVEGARARAVVEQNGLAVADVFAIPGKDFVELCPNHPDKEVRGESRAHFSKLVEFAEACGAKHLSVLPGIVFDSEPFDASLQRCAEELNWRRELTRNAGLVFAVEAHTGSIIANPSLAARLMRMVPGLTLTLDLGHFIAQGFQQSDANALIEYTSHVHARCASPGRLQASLKTNRIDFQDLVGRLAARQYQGWYAIEYVWIDWEHCNEVDNVSETILLKEALESAAKIEA
jgi:sugar phosphate isomerase/epimerase